MANKNHTKRALLSSALAMLLCFAMLIGTTFAWFTDEVSSGINTIQAGNLDVDVVDANDTSITERSRLFDGVALWEPGAMAWEELTVVNKGTLALKYAMTIAFDEANATKNNKGQTLADILKVAVLDAAPTRESIKSATLIPMTDFVLDGEGSLEKDTEKTYYIAIYWAPSANDNDFNLVGGMNINLGVKLVATQLPSEEDSFDEMYDSKAWYEENADADVFAINTVADLYSFAGAVNNGMNFAGETVVLNKNLDLENAAWTPIGSYADGKAFAGTFDGNGKTISNLYVKITDNDAGLFGWVSGNVKNLTVDNARVTNAIVNKDSIATGVIAGRVFPKGVIENCSVNESVVSGNRWVGGLAGYAYGTLKNNTVYGGVVTATPNKVGEKYDNGDKAGGLVGYLGDNYGIASGNTVSYTTLTAYRDLGGITGTLYSSSVATFKNNKVVGCDLTADRMLQNEYVAEKSVNAGAIVGATFSGATPDATNTATSTSIRTLNPPTAYAVDTAQELYDALTAAGASGAGNSLVNITTDIDMSGFVWTPVYVNGYTGADIITVNGNGNSLTNLSAPIFKGGFAGGSGIIINDLTIEDSNVVSTNTQGSGAFIESVDSMSVITLSNCHLKNSTVTGSRTGGLIGWTSGYSNTSDGSVKMLVTIKDCSVVGCEITGNGSVGGINGHAGSNSWTYTLIEDCVVKNNTITAIDSGSRRVGCVIGTANIGEAVINRVEISGNKLTQKTSTAADAIVRDNITNDRYYGRTSLGSTGSLTIDGVAIGADEYKW